MMMDTMPNTDMSSADERRIKRAMECRADSPLSAAAARERALEEFFAWFPPGTKWTDDSDHSPVAEMDPCLASLGFDEEDEPVVVAQVDKHTMDEAMRNKEEPDELFFRQSEEIRVESQNYALAALSYLRKRGHNLKLVKACLYEGEDIPGALRYHFNFKAKRADKPGAPTETYFAQLLDYGNSKYIVERCISLGKSDSLPYKREKHGCRICTEYVHHPKHGRKDGIW